MKLRSSLPVGIVLALAVILFTPSSSAEIGDCPNGYEFQPSSGVGCVQINCADVENAHYSYTSRCICGSAGSIYENPEDPNTSCNYPSDYESCPGCTYACVHADEKCPDAPGVTTNKNTNTTNTANTNVSSNTNARTNTNKNINVAVNTNQNVNSSNANSTPPITTAGVLAQTCADECNKFLRGKKNAEVLSAEGDPPDCACQIDVRDNGGNVTETISVEGPVKTTYTFDPSSGALISKTVLNIKDEVEKIRKRLGYRYTEKEIDELLAPEKIDKWFQEQISPIKTETGLLHPQFWWQHVVAMLDHGASGNSAEFVDINQFGRCGDSMMWLERNLTANLNLGDDVDEPGQKHEAMLSITGEKYGNMLNHTSLMVRPPGMTNYEWEEIVKELKNLSGGAEGNPGMVPGTINNIDPRLLDAKVLDPYKKQVTTVREFIKGWSYIRIS
ncbi:MAG: hypothetical protein V1685_06055 [Parcubacteria group bacterium]